MGGELEARGYVVRGRVQGVGFRWFTQRAGIRLGLAGHVGNLRDGGVEVHARGTAEALQTFEAALRQGPASSRVDTVIRVPADPRTPERGFSVEAW
ncbi:MAG TPA: acylphosphatase [Longimicrobiales bacterium]|nr:acylphosphatase [Longimicrobiales bacterium]